MSYTCNKATQPVASFVVARVQGEGYCINFSDGPLAEELEPEVLPALGMLAKTPGRGERGKIYGVIPAGESRDWVGVHSRELESGNVEYCVSWFRNPPPAIKMFFLGRIVVAICLLILTFGGGYVAAVVNPMAVKQVVEEQETWAGSSLDIRGVNARDREIDAIKHLRDTLTETVILRKELTSYLAQKGLSTDPSLHVTNEKRAVKISSDLDWSTPTKESIKLSNWDVRKLLDLLAALGQCSETLSLHDNELESLK